MEHAWRVQTVPVEPGSFQSRKPTSVEHVVQVEWGIDMSSEHERYLAERVFKSPVIVYNYPKDIKVGDLT